MGTHGNLNCLKIFNIERECCCFFFSPCNVLCINFVIRRKLGCYFYIKVAVLSGGRVVIIEVVAVNQLP